MAVLLIPVVTMDLSVLTAVGGVYNACMVRRVGSSSFLVDSNNILMDGGIPVSPGETRDDNSDGNDVARFISFNGCKAIDAGYKSI